MFKALNNEEMEIVIGAMTERCFKSGEVVIKQGEAGAVLYVVEEGQLACHKLFDGSSEPKFLKNFEPGDLFGELALLYNAPRAATVTAKSDVVLWELDRDTFNHIVKDSAQRKREKYEDFLSSVKILHSVDSYERAKMADTIKEQDFNKGQRVIAQGDEGNDFYLILSGEAYASKVMAGGKEQEVMQYKAGDYFGELALLKNEPRAASVFAKTQLKVATIDRDSFKRLLGPLDQILMRNMQAY